jgi:hypothetical protein
MRPDNAVWSDMPVKGLPGDPQLGTEISDLGFRFTHRCLGESYFC